MLYTIHCYHRTVQLDVADFQYVKWVPHYFMEYYRAGQEILNCEWYVYYEMPQLLNIKLLRKLSMDRTMIENGVRPCDVIIGLFPEDIFTYFQKETDPNALYEPINPAITVFDLKRAIHCQIMQFLAVEYLELLRGHVPLLDQYSLASYQLRPGEALLMIPRSFTPNSIQVTSSWPVPPFEAPKKSVEPPPPTLSPQPVRAKTASIITRSKAQAEQSGDTNGNRKKEELPPSFDCYINQLGREDDEKELTVYLRGNFPKFLSTNPAAASATTSVSPTPLSTIQEVSGEISLLSCRVKVTCSLLQIKQYLYHTYPTLKKYHIAFFSGPTKLTDDIGIIEVMESVAASTVIELMVRFTETLSSRIEQIYYSPLHTTTAATASNSSSIENSYTVSIYPPASGTTKIAEAVEVLPCHLQLYIVFRDDSSLTTTGSHHHQSPFATFNASSLSPFREVFNIQQVMIQIQTGIEHQEIPCPLQITGHQFAIEVRLPPFGYYRMMITYQDRDHIRQLVFPFYTIPEDHSEKVNREEYEQWFLCQPFLKLMNRMYRPALKSLGSETRRILIRCHVSELSAMKKAAAGEEKEEAEGMVTKLFAAAGNEILEFPLIIQQANHCLVQDLKQKLLPLFGSQELQSIHCYYQDQRLADLLPLARVITENDAVIHIQYTPSLRDLLVEARIKPSLFKRHHTYEPRVISMASTAGGSGPIELPTTFCLQLVVDARLATIISMENLTGRLIRCRDQFPFKLDVQTVTATSSEAAVSASTDNNMMTLSMEINYPLEEHQYYQIEITYYHQQGLAFGGLLDVKKFIVLFQTETITPRKKMELYSSLSSPATTATSAVRKGAKRNTKATTTSTATATTTARKRKARALSTPTSLELVSSEGTIKKRFRKSSQKYSEFIEGTEIDDAED